MPRWKGFPSHLCEHCGARSYNPADIFYRYCGSCHHYCDDAEDDRGPDDAPGRSIVEVQLPDDAA